MSGERSSRRGKPKNVRPVLHDFGYVLKKNYWIFLIAVAFFLITIPFLTAGLSGDSIFNIEVTHEQLKFRLIHDNYLYIVQAGAVVFGLIAGIALFRFLQDKKETTIFFSLGVTRLQLARNRCLAGLLMLFAGIAVPMFVSMGLNLRALGIYNGLIRDTLYLIAGLSVTAFVSFFATVVVSALSGTVAETLVGWCGVMSAPCGICFALNQLMHTLYWGNAWGAAMYGATDAIRPGLVEQFSWLSPYTFFYKELQTHSQYWRPQEADILPSLAPGVLIGWCVVAVVLAILCAVLIRRRKAEQAGIRGLNRLLAEFLIAFTSFLVFSLVFSFLYPFSTWLAVLLGLAALFVVHLFWRRTLFSYSMALWKQLVSFVVSAVIAIVLCLVFFTGGFGSAERYLDSDKAVEASVSYVGSPSLLYETASGSSTGNGYYVTSQITFDDPDEVALVQAAQKSFLDSGQQPLALNETDFCETVIPYDVLFSYTDADGKEHTWYYDRASFVQLEQLLSLEGTTTAEEGVARMFEGTLTSETTVWASEAYRTGDVYLLNEWCTESYLLDLSEEQRQELLAALEADYTEKSIDEIYYPTEETQAVLMFSRNGAYDAQYYAFNLNNVFLYITEQDEHTMAWLAQNDLLDLVSVETQIESITFQSFDPYVSKNDMTYPFGVYFMSYRADTSDDFMFEKDFGLKYIATEEDEIAEYLPGLRNGYFMSDGGYLAAVKVAGVDGYTYMFLPAEYAPEE